MLFVGFGFFHCGLKGWKINFPQGSFVNIRADVVAIELLVVSGEVLGGGDDALVLNTVDYGHRHSRCQEWIFPEVLEVPAAHRGAIDIHARSKNELHAAGTGVFAHHGAESLYQFCIPGGG